MEDEHKLTPPADNEPVGLEADFLSLVSGEEPEAESTEEASPEDEIIQEIPEEVEEPVEEPDWKAMFLKEEQRRKTSEGRFAKFREDQKAHEEEMKRQMEMKHEEHPHHDDHPKPEDHEEFWNDYEVMLAPITDLVNKLIDKRISTIRPEIDEVKTVIKTQSEYTFDNEMRRLGFRCWAKMARSPEMKEWMDSLPRKLNNGQMDGQTADRIFKSGTPQEAAHLLSLFKASDFFNPELEVEKGGSSAHTNNFTEPTEHPIKEDPLVQRVVAAQAVESGVTTPPPTKARKHNSFEDDFNDMVKRGKR